MVKTHLSVKEMRMVNQAPARERERKDDKRGRLNEWKKCGDTEMVPYHPRHQPNNCSSLVMGLFFFLRINRCMGE